MGFGLDWIVVCCQGTGYLSSTSHVRLAVGSNKGTLDDGIWLAAQTTKPLRVGGIGIYLVAWWRLVCTLTKAS